MINYTITVGFETDQIDKDGNVKIKKYRYLVSAHSVEEAMLVIAKYRSEIPGDSEVISITKATYEDIINEVMTPKYYEDNGRG